MRFLTAGESHGQALVGILEGMPSGLGLSKEDIQKELFRRKQGPGRGDRQKIETEDLQILSGVRFGKTLGSPITLLIENKDFKNWEKTMSTRTEDETSDREVIVPRPGHADFVGALKYDFEDMRNVLERASARETAMRVAIASVARKFLKTFGIEIASQVLQIGEARTEEKIKEEIERAASEGDTLGGIFEIRVNGLPAGLGSYAQWDRRIEGKLAQSLMSLNAIKGFEMGEGFASSTQRGSQVHDEMAMQDDKIHFQSNRSGGVTGGMTTGQTLWMRAAMKPLSTLKKSLASVSMRDLTNEQAHFERSDVCAVHSAAVIGESLVALVLAEEFLIKFGGDSMAEILPRYQQWIETHERKTSAKK